MKIRQSGLLQNIKMERLQRRYIPFLGWSNTQKQAPMELHTVLISREWIEKRSYRC